MASDFLPSGTPWPANTSNTRASTMFGLVRALAPRAADRPRPVVRHEEGEIARHRLQRGRGVGGSGEAACALLRRDRVEEDLDRRHRPVDVEGLERRGMQHRRSARARSSGRAAGWPTGRGGTARPLRPSPSACRPAHRPLRAARAPSALASRHRNRCALPLAQPRGVFSPASTTPASALVARAVLAAQVAPADLEQPRAAAPRSALRLAADSRPGSSEGRMAFMSSLIGLSSTHSASAVGEMLGLRHRAGRTRSPPRSARAPPRRGAAAFERLLRRGGRAGDAVGARQRHALDLVEAVDAHDFLDQIGRRLRYRGGAAGR